MLGKNNIISNHNIYITNRWLVIVSMDIKLTSEILVSLHYILIKNYLKDLLE